MGVIRNFIFGLKVNGSKSQPADEKIFSERGTVMIT